MPKIPDWVVRLQRWPVGVTGEFLGTVLETNPRAKAAKRWLRRLFMTQAEQLAIFTVLMGKGIITQDEYEQALQRAAHILCEELEAEFPGIVSRDDGVSIDIQKAYAYMKDWPL